MNVTASRIPGVLYFEARAYPDGRGRFAEVWRNDRYREAGIKETFVQDNYSYSVQGALRGLHAQNPNPQGKLVVPLVGEIFDVALDLRTDAKTFGQWVSFVLSAEKGGQLYVPPGFAHGFYVSSPTALVLYKCTDYYNPKGEGTVAWNDPDLKIPWPTKKPLLSEKDGKAPFLKDLPREWLPTTSSVSL